VTGERTRGSVTFERLGRRRGREGKRRGEWGVWPWGCHMARERSWGLAPTVSWLAVTRARRARAARQSSDRGTPGADGWALVAVRAGREQRGVRGMRACVGRPEKKTELPSPDEQYGLAFIQINSKEFKLI
jgi:hypothetical protein